MRQSTALPTTAPEALYRALSDAEIDALQRSGCRCSDWSRVRVAADFSPAAVRDVEFSGDIRLGSFRHAVRLPGGWEHPSGIYRAALHHCRVGNDVLIRNVGRHIAHYDIGERAVIDHVALLAVEGETAFGNGTRIQLLCEAGGREVPIFDRLHAAWAYVLAAYRHRSDVRQRVERWIADHAAQRRSTRGYVGPGATLCDCGTLVNLWIGPAAHLIGARRLVDGTVHSAAEAPTKMGDGVLAEHFIAAQGSRIDSGAQVRHAFIGQGTVVACGFSAEHCAVFANCELLHGEARNLLAGPYTVSHHKATLLIAGAVSFFNAGSGTNQSNHLYKLGPLHQGILQRGVRTGSSSHVIWPCHVGAFSLVAGRHRGRFDTSDFPFSYLVEDHGASVLIPAANLPSAGWRRDQRKWPQRDRRTALDRLDWIHFPVFNPHSMGAVLRGRELLQQLDATTPPDQEWIALRGVQLPRQRLHRAAGLYTLAWHAYRGWQFARKLAALLGLPDPAAETTPLDDGPGRGETPPRQPSFAALRAALLPAQQHGAGPWVDLCGLLAPQSRLLQLLDDVASGRLGSLAEADIAWQELFDRYSEYEWQWVVHTWLHESGLSAADVTPGHLAAVIEAWRQAAVPLNNLALRDAASEFAAEARIGFGLDGDECDVAADFRAVRGTYEAHPLVAALQQENARIADTSQQLLQALQSLTA
jgi:hypothetical protein